MRKFAKKNAKLVAAVTLAASLMAAPSVFALNYVGGGDAGSGNKPLSFIGYKYLDNGASADTLQLNFSKEIVSPAEVLTSTNWQKVVTVTGGASNPTVSSVSISAGNDYDDSNHYSKGTRVVFTFNGELDADTEYTVTIKNLLNNSNGISLGNYMNRKDLTFKFRTPDGTGAYTGNPSVAYVVGDPNDVSSSVYQNVSWESDLTVIFDRPMYSSQVSTYETGLDDNYEKNVSGTWTDVALSESSGSYEGYPPHHNDALTTFFFPMTNNSDTACFNRSQSANGYRLALPTDFYDTNNRHTTAYSGGGSTFYFNTVSTDYPGWESNGDKGNAALDVTSPGAHKLHVVFYPTPVTPSPDGYDVYVTNGDKFTGTYTKMTDVTFGDDGKGNLTATVNSGVPAGNCFLRLVPTNTSNLSVGFSIANDNAVPVSD